MVDLTPVGLSTDRKHLILVSDRGEEFTVPLDHRLRAALRDDQTRLGQLEMTMESTLRPRDIQSRIRGGDSAEEVAAAAQTTVDKIMPFAGPVLAERAHIAESAQASSVRRSSGEPSGARVLTESAGVHLRAVGARLEDVAWDAWRREDGRWTVVADYLVEGRPRHAEFTYDVPGRYVVAENDEARRLTGEVRSAEPAPRAAPRRLSAVPSGQDELPLGDDAIELVREDDEAARVAGGTDAHADAPAGAQAGAPAGAQAGAQPDTADEELTSDLTGVADELTADHADADWITRDPAPAGSDAAAPADPEVHPKVDPEVHPEVGPVDGAAPVDEPVHEPEPEPTSESTAESTAEPAAEEQPRPARRKGRSSVPSWDEIMFGGGGRSAD